MVITLALTLLCLLIGGSVYLRVRHFRNSLEGFETRSSPLAMAVQEIVATAGGVYLSLIMLISFLKIDLPPTVSYEGIKVDPTALISIALAIVQPLFLRLFEK